MTTSLLLSIVLISQTASSKSVPSTEKAAAVAKAPAKADYKATIQSTIERKKAAQGKKSKARMAKRLHEQAESKAQRDQAVRMAPAMAAQQREDLRLQMEGQALQQMSGAMMQNAAINQARFQLQSQQAGAPQIFVPGQGYSPYAGGIANPYPPVIVVP